MLIGFNGKTRLIKRYLEVYIYIYRPIYYNTLVTGDANILVTPRSVHLQAYYHNITYFSWYTLVLSSFFFVVTNTGVSYLMRELILLSVIFTVSSCQTDIIYKRCYDNHLIWFLGVAIFRILIQNYLLEYMYQINEDHTL